MYSKRSQDDTCLGGSNFLVELHLGEPSLHVLLCVGQHDVARVVVHADIGYINIIGIKL